MFSENWLSYLRTFLLAVSALGALCFGLLFAATFLNPKLIADAARSFVIEETKDRYAEYRAQVLQNETAEKALNFLKQRYESKLQDLPQTVKRIEMLVGALIDSFCQTRQCDEIWADPEARRKFFATEQAHEAGKLSQALVTIEGFLKKQDAGGSGAPDPGCADFLRHQSRDLCVSLSAGGVCECAAAAAAVEADRPAAGVQLDRGLYVPLRSKLVFHHPL